MKVYFLCLFWRLTYSMTNKIVNVDRFVMESTIRSTPHKTIENVENELACANRCSLTADCCGFTLEHSTMNCLLFYYQTSNKCQNTPEGSANVQLIKQLTDCSELPPDIPSGVYRVYPSRQDAVLLYCEMTDAGGGWTVIQRRQDGSEDFYRYWTDYKRGFGDLENEFWIGNDIIHSITLQKQYKVRFDLEDFDGQTAYAEYEHFHVDNELMSYGLNISGYSGTAGDVPILNYAETGILPFSTRDVDNDQAPKSCADRKKSGWWFRACTTVNINGMYLPGVSDQMTMHWLLWREMQGLNKTRMMIQPSSI